MKWRALDLNLIVVFDAVMQERSATAAATRLNMTQPAVSHALSRLRGALKDDLFVRTPDGMEPTPYAKRLADPVRRALEELGTALESADDFQPAVAERVFTLGVNNHSTLVLAAPLAAAVAAEAPGITLDMRAARTLNVEDRLDRGELDFAIGGLAAPGERFSDLRLFEDGFAALLRQGHPACSPDGTITLQALASLPHLAVSSNGEGTGFVDEELARHELGRHIALHAPLIATGDLLAQSDLVAVLSVRAAREFARRRSLQIMQLPFSSPKVVTALLWHRRFDDVGAHRWLRRLISRVAKTLELSQRFETVPEPAV